MRVYGISKYQYNTNKYSAPKSVRYNLSPSIQTNNTNFKGNVGRFFGALLGVGAVLTFAPACPIIVCAGPLIGGLLMMQADKFEEELYKGRDESDDNSAEDDIIFKDQAE